MNNIHNVGDWDIEGRKLICNFIISSDEFFDKFSTQIDDLPLEVRTELENSINEPDNVMVKLGKKSPGILTNLFEQCAELSAPIDGGDSSTSTGFDSDEMDQAREAEDLKRTGATSNEIVYNEDHKTDEGIETFDENTGKKEGVIILGDKGATGDLVPLEITETINATYEHNAEEPMEEGRSVDGAFKISNPSVEHKLWDVDVTFEREKDIVWKSMKTSEDQEEGEAIDLNDPIHINTLDPSSVQIYEYGVEAFENPSLKINEFISTLNDEEVETYSLVPGGDNTILFKITATNTADYAISDVNIVKKVEEIFMNVNVIEGEAELDGDSIVWNIESLEAGEEVVLKINMDLDTTDKEVKARTGIINATYNASSAFTGMTVDKFDAYSSNFVGISANQKDDDPDAYECALVFENKSDFQVNLVNLDVVEEGKPDEKLMDIDTGEIPTIASGAQWQSIEWETQTEDGFEPMFHKMVEFFLVSERKVSTTANISMNDLELAVAMLTSMVYYSVGEIASYRETAFDALLAVKNSGSAELNELVLEETIQAGYIPPNPEDIEIYVVRDSPEGEGLEEGGAVDWELLGDQIMIDPSMIVIEPADQDPEVEHVLKINLTDLSNNEDMGMFAPNMIVKAKYPITAYKPAQDSEYVSNARFLANTLPAGSPLESVPDESEVVVIPVTHKRQKTIKGKAIRALATEGEYEITLSIKNTGDATINDVKIRDAVDKNNFEYSDLSAEPAEYQELEGKDLLVWSIEEIAPGDSVDITYTITGKGDYKVSDNQFSC